MLRPIVLAAATLPILLAGGCSREGPAYAPRSADAAGVVEMTNAFAFSPDTLTIPAGTTVEWRNTSLIAHSVTADLTRVEDPETVALPPGAQPLDSGRIARGQTWRHTFTVPGTYRYICVLHDWLGMSGTIEVTEPLGPAPLAPAPAQPTS